MLAITHEHWDHLSGFIQAPDSFAKLEGRRGLGRLDRGPKDDLANSLRSELGQGGEAELAACATALHAVGDGATVEMLADIALTPFGAAASSSASTKAAFDKVKAMGKVQDMPAERQAVRDSATQMRESTCSVLRTIPSSSARSIRRRAVRKPMGSR